MTRKADSLTAIPKGWLTPPFLMNDITSMVGNRWLVLERTVGGWLAVRASVGMESYLTHDIIYDKHCSRQSSRARRFHPWEHNVNQITGEQRSFDDHLRAYRLMALQQGATAEAIRLLHQHYQPFTEKEAADMADKLTKKTDAPKKGADKPAAEKKGGKGNPEALKKAREAAAEKGPDVRKITILKKENPYREGSGRAASFDALKGAKTVEDYKNAGGKVKYISRWESEGIIKLG